MKPKIIVIIAGLLLIASGLFLIIERFFIHAISFDYSKVGLSFLDPFIDHWMFGLIFLIVGVFLLFATKK